MTAHAINMGLFRPGGALQGVTTKAQWNILGYDILEGDFKKIGQPVTITRLNSESLHPIDQEDFPWQEALASNFVIKTFGNEHEEIQWIAQQVANDIQLGFEPADIFITAIFGNNEKNYLNLMKSALKQKGIDAYITGVDGNPSIFRIDGCVTISNIFRAKGNEAWKVYACRFNYVNEPLAWKQEQELYKRNEAFVALTRTKIWCVVTGMKAPIFDELQTATAQYPHFTFPAFNQASLQRVTEEEDDDYR